MSTDNTETSSDATLDGVDVEPDYNDIRETPADEPDGPIVAREREASERAAEQAARTLAPESPAVASGDVRRAFQVRMEGNGDPSIWEQGIIYAASEETAREGMTASGMLRDGMHIAWIREVAPVDASGLA